MWPVVLLVLVADPSVVREPRIKHPFLAPSDIVKRLDASPRTYKFDQMSEPTAEWLEENAKAAWGPGTARGFDIPLVSVGASGERTVREWEAPQAAAELEARAKERYAAADWEGAEKAYAALLQKFPAHYRAQVAWADCALNTGRYPVALERYQKATALNAADHRSWYGRGNALLALGKKAEAVKAYAHALALRPRSEELLTGLDAHAESLGLRVRRDLLLPHARVTEDGDAVAMVITAEPHWLAWASCKALWLGEASHRREMTGHEPHVFTNVEEEECLANLGAAYELKTKAKKDYTPDPVAQLVYDVAKADLLEAFVLYALAPRIEPHVMLQLPDEQVARVEELIRRFVFVPQQPPR